MVNKPLIITQIYAEALRKGTTIKEVYERPKEAHRFQNEDTRREEIIRIKMERTGIFKSIRHDSYCHKSTH